MAVGPELAGMRVRCPHCQEIVVAPADNPAEILGADNPFQFGSAPAPESRPSVSEVKAPAIPEMAFRDRDDRPAPDPVSRASRSGAGSHANWVLAILVPYALFMTVMAVFYYVKYQNAQNLTPLELIPDVLGDFQQKQTKAGAQTKKLPPPDQNLPAKMLTTLGKPIQIGAIEVTPLSIEYRPWMAFVREKNRPQPREVPIKSTLVLRVRLKNISPDLTFFPTDPYFDRNPKLPSDQPYTLVDVGGRKIYGGVVEYLTDPGNTERTWLAGQEDDDKPLGPGQSRETVLLTRPRDTVYDIVQKAAGPVVWRMQVRRGVVPFQGTDVPVSAVVGVSFTAADVKASAGRQPAGKAKG
jgi:hypothetical protein